MSSANTNTKVPTPSNPSSLNPRYEIRRLEPQHKTWAAAIVVHSNLFHSPLWPVLYPSNITSNLHKALPAADYLVTHQIASGLSFGVFDTAYTYKRPESQSTAGNLYWDAREAGVQESAGLEAESARLLQQMDFPLVSVALSYDGFHALDMAQMKPLLAALPHFGLVYHILAGLDTRDPRTWAPTAENQVLLRNATATRRDYEGRGVMSGLARWLMREAAGRGFRAVQIETVSDSVEHVWAKPEEPFRGRVVCAFDTATWRDGEGREGFGDARQRVTKCYVELKPEV